VWLVNRVFNQMKLGILVNSDKHCEDVVGITRAALSAGHAVMIFVMDEGTRLLEEATFVQLSEMEELRMSYCNYNAEGLGISKKLIPNNLISGSQYENSIMIHESDKIIVL
jgi:peroxiredoxin family protein